MLNAFPYLKAKQSLHTARSMGELWWKHRKCKHLEKIKQKIDWEDIIIFKMVLEVLYF